MRTTVKRAAAPVRATGLAAIALACLPGAALAEPSDVERAAGGARAPAPDLRREGSVESLGVTFHRYRQEVDGVPVLESEAVVAEPEGGEALLADDSTAPPARAAGAGRPELRRGEAVRAAGAAIGTTDRRARPRAELAIDPGEGGGTLVWRVLLASTRPLGDYEVLVDARSGEVVSVRDLLARSKGRARIFLPNAVVANGGPEGLSDAGDADTKLLTSLRSRVQLKRLDSDSRCLKGSAAHATLRSGEVCSKSRQFGRLTRADAAFEAVMAYFHVDTTQAYIRSLGFDNVMDRSLDVRVNRLKTDNSFYSPITGKLTLGTGGVDDGEDGEVIVHEYGHAIQDDQVRFFGQSPDAAAMGEGFGDYLSAAMASRMPGSTPAFEVCVFEWDSLGANRSRACLRRLDSTATLADVGPGTACGGEIHCVGEVWGSSLWRLRAVLGNDGAGRNVMDRLVVQSHFALAPGPTFRAGARAILHADKALYGNLHRRTIAEEFERRGFLR